MGDLDTKPFFRSAKPLSANESHQFSVQTETRSHHENGNNIFTIKQDLDRHVPDTRSEPKVRQPFWR